MPPKPLRNPDKCTNCGGNGPFDKDKRKRSGHASWCRACKNKGNREWANKNKEQESNRRKKWYENNKNYFKEKGKIWKLNHPNYFSNNAAKWRLEHIEESRTATRNRQARQRGASGSFTADEWIKLRDSYDNRCVYCNEKKNNLQADHIVPLILGGSNNISNIVPACQSCNASKNGRPLLIWMLSKIN